MATVPVPQGATFSPVQAPASTPVPQGASFSPAQSAPQSAAPETAQISAIHEPTTYMGKIARWVDNVSNDIKYGTDETGIGTVLKKMGAHGVYSGNSEAVGDFMASLPLGLLKATKGGAEVTPQVLGGEKGKTWQGVKDLVGGGLQAVTMPAAFAAPEETALSKEGLLSDAANAAAKGTEQVADVAAKAGNKVADAASNAKSLLFPDEKISSQVTKDLIKRALGNKVDSDVAEELAGRVNKPKIFSSLENELKLVKPQLDSDLSSANTQLDSVLADSTAKAGNSQRLVNKVFSDLVGSESSGVGTGKKEIVSAINNVRDEILPRLTNEPTSAQELNDLKRLVGDQIKKFAPPDMLNSAQKAEQEAYRQTYFKLRDMVSELVPESKDLNSKISRGLNAQDLLEKKFPQLGTAEEAKASYQGTRATAAKVAAKKAARVGIVGGGAEELIRHTLKSATSQ